MKNLENKPSVFLLIFVIVAGLSSVRLLQIITSEVNLRFNRSWRSVKSAVISTISQHSVRRPEWLSCEFLIMLHPIGIARKQFIIQTVKPQTTNYLPLPDMIRKPNGEAPNYKHSTLYFSITYRSNSSKCRSYVTISNRFLLTVICGNI